MKIDQGMRNQGLSKNINEKRKPTSKHAQITLEIGLH
jgi:hypothetical protein